MTITIPVAAALNGGNLYTLVDDLTNVNSGITKQTINGGTDLQIVDDDLIPVKMDQANLLTILAEGGEVAERLMAIKMPTSFASTDVPAGVPYRENVVGGARTFSEWFITGSEVWLNTIDGFVLYYTNPLGSVADQSQFLKGSEMEIIRQLDTINISIMSIDEAQVEIAGNPNYVKKVW